MTVERNQFDKRDSLELGNNAQDLFKQLAEVRGWEVSTASSKQDINEHWDFLLTHKQRGITFRVDVKAMKRLNRWDNALQDEWVWIELHGVRKDESGWLLGGKADIFAFEKKQEFVLIKKQDLKSIVSMLVSSDKVTIPQNAKYKLYSRPGRPDLITLIEMNQIEVKAWERWQKV